MAYADLSDSTASRSLRPGRPMGRVRRWLALAVLLLSSLCGVRVPAVAADPAEAGSEERVSALERELARYKGMVAWLEMERELLSPVNAQDGEAVTVPVEFRRERSLLARVRMPARPTREDLKRYIASVLLVARQRSVYTPSDPAPTFLARVGSGNLDLLLEPLAYFPHRIESLYLVRAVGAIVTEEQKDMVLSQLQLCHPLLAIVRERGWTQDAATTIRAVIRERSPHLSLEWIEAAAVVAVPDDYADLEWYVCNAGEPYYAWESIRNLISRERLDAVIRENWQRIRADKGNRLGGTWFKHALVAAHYGHVDALAGVIDYLDGPSIYRQSYEQLTGRSVSSVSDEVRWFAAARARLRFDTDRHMFVASD